jgi:hypothetical protein
MIYIQDVSGGKVSILGGGVIVSAILSKKYMYTCPIPNGFRDTAISNTVAKLLIRKRYYGLFLIQVCIVQVTKLVRFT